MRKVAVCALVVLTLAIGCRKKEDPIHAVIDAAVSAAEDRDADALGTLISNTFKDPDNHNRDEVVQLARRYFSAYKSIDLRVSGIKVEKRPTFIGASFDVTFSGTPAIQGGLGDLLPRSSKWNFWIEIENENGTWRIVWAEWKQIGGDRL